MEVRPCTRLGPCFGGQPGQVRLPSPRLTVTLGPHVPPPSLAGTTRLQLTYKGDTSYTYTNFANVVVAFAFLTIPIIGWLLDKKVR